MEALKATHYPQHSASVLSIFLGHLTSTLPPPSLKWKLHSISTLNLPDCILRKLKAALLASASRL